MRLATKITAAALTANLILLLLPASLAAQSIWIDRHVEQGLSLEALKPIFPKAKTPRS